MRNRLILTVLLLMAALLSWVFWIAATSYMRAPRMVAELDRAGVLAFSPSELPKSRLCALLVVQDPTFYRHWGIGLADGPPGHTTITQSIGKGLFFSGFDPGLLRHRKIRLMVAAWAFDRHISKDAQLRLFLNRAYFGGTGERAVIGFPAAASACYGKPLGFGILRPARDVGGTQPLPCSTSGEDECRARRKDSAEGADSVRRRMFSGRCAFSMRNDDDYFSAIWQANFTDFETATSEP